jgi:predicted nuclease with TOPRIM domain
MNQVNVIGIRSMEFPETRALLLLEVVYNGNTYDWQIFCKEGMNHNDFLTEEIKQKIYDDIQKKEDEWENLTPKTRTVSDILGDGEMVVDIQKEEIVKPDIPDYYAKRRNEYPPLGDQFDAIFKGVDSSEYQNILQRIQEVKQKYPKT